MPTEAGYYDADGGMVVFRSMKDQPAEAFDTAFKQRLVGQKPLGFSIEKVDSLKPTGLLHEARQALKSARESASSAIDSALTSLVPPFAREKAKGVSEAVSNVINPVPGTTTDAGQLGGTGLGMLAGSLLLGPGLGTAAGAILGSGLGRMGGSMLEEKPDPYVEGATGLATGFVPAALRGAALVGRTALARQEESKVVKDVLGQVQQMLPQGAPKLAKDMGRFQQQMSATGRNSLVQWAKDEFRNELDQINATIGDMKVRIPSLGAGPVKVRDVIEAISEKGQRMVAGQEPKTFGQKVAAVGQRQIREELDYVLRSNGMYDIADGYQQARNNFARTNEVVRLFTKAAESRRPLDLAAGKIDLSKLQQQFLKTREIGGLKPFTDVELEALERKLGRGKLLTGVDQPMNLPGLISLGMAPGRNAGLRIAAPSIPHAAGVRYQSPTALERLVLPQLLGQQFTGGSNEQ